MKGSLECGLQHYDNVRFCRRLSAFHREIPPPSWSPNMDATLNLRTLFSMRSIS